MQGNGKIKSARKRVDKWSQTGDRGFIEARVYYAVYTVRVSPLFMPFGGMAGKSRRANPLSGLGTSCFANSEQSNRPRTTDAELKDRSAHIYEDQNMEADGLLKTLPAE